MVPASRAAKIHWQKGEKKMSSAISASLVKDLRERTGAGMMDCKKALEATGGNIDKAIEELRKKGLQSLGKRSGKVTAEGCIGVYAHAGDQIVAIVELSCETDFVARGEEFKRTARDIAMHVSAMKPGYVSAEEVPAELIEKEKSILLEQLSDDQKQKADKIIPGRISKFLAEVALLEQPFIKDDSGKKTVGDLVSELSLKVGEKVQIRRFERFEVGEGVEKEVTDLAAEVAAFAQAAS
jgi:elongation factor Ts